jgi:hypothetical protein
MSVWVPPYFGSYEQLVAELLNNPSLGSGRGGLVPAVRAEESRHHNSELNPQPLPPFQSPVISYLATLVSMQELSKNVANPAVAKQLATSADAAFAAFLDDYCGTPPRQIPWPWPGPPPWVIALAAEVVSVANTYQAGAFRDGLLSFAGRIAEKGLGAQTMAGAASAR